MKIADKLRLKYGFGGFANMASKMKGGGMGGFDISQILSLLPDESQTYNQGKTGLGKTAKGVTADVAGTIAEGFGIPMVGEALKGLDAAGTAIKGDGTNAWQNIGGNVINPLNTVGKLAEGQFLEAIPLVGGYFEAIEAADKKSQMETAERNMDKYQNNQQSSQNLANYPTSGIVTRRMREGGLLNHNPFSVQEGGEAIPLNEEAALMIGNKHEQGGINIGKNVEVEGGETISNVGGQSYVHSDKLINPKTGNTFAKDSLTLEKEMGRFEKLLEKRPDDFRVKNIVELLKSRREDLAMENEKIKHELEETQMQEQQEQGGDAQQLMLQQLMTHQGEEQQQFAIGGFVNPNSLNMPSQGIKRLIDYGKKSPNYAGVAGNFSNIIPETPQTLVETPQTKTNPQSSFDLESLNLDRTVPYLDNLVNAGIIDQKRGREVPVQNLLGYIQPRTVNYDNQRQEAQRQTRTFNNDLLSNSSNSSVANSNLAMGLAERIRAVNDVNRNEANKNQEILAMSDKLNNDISLQNNTTQYRDKIEAFKYIDSLDSQKGENVADAVKDRQGQLRDKKAEEQQQLGDIIQIMSADGTAGYDLLQMIKSNPDLAKRFGNLLKMESSLKEKADIYRKSIAERFKQGG